MGKYDDISADRLRADLVAFAQLILRLDREDGVLVSPADLQRMLGDLRQKIFAYEIRKSRMREEEGEKGRAPKSPDEGGSEHDGASDGAGGGRTDRGLDDSLRVVREAIRRREEMVKEWEGRESEDTDDDE